MHPLSRLEFQHIDPSKVEPLVEEERRALRSDARVSSFIDILAERRVRERLRDAATIDRAERPPTDASPRVVNAQNEGRAVRTVVQESLAT
jgi:hypothetical protein